MIKHTFYLFVLLITITSCKQKEVKKTAIQFAPTVTNNGSLITFTDTGSLSFFKTEQVDNRSIEAALPAPGKIAATVLPSDEDASQNIILFDNPELAGNYTQLIQHQININQIQSINIKQKQIELDRFKDLQQHGAATGRDLLNAQAELTMAKTNLANEKAAIIEHETKLKSSGFNPILLREAPAGTAYIICDIPENQIEKLKEGQICTISFTAFPNEIFNGKVDAIADMVDNTTRMVKVRIYINNTSGKLKTGMFANVSFTMNEGNFISINKTSIITVQGKNYAFIKKSQNEFERKEINTGQQIGDRIIVFSGLNNGDKIVTNGVMQLKGLSFGY